MPPATLLRLQETIVPTAVARGVWVGESDICGAHPADVFPVSHMVIAHRDKAGKIERFSGIMRDISEAKATEVALFESEARLRTIADALPMRVAFIDTAQRYRFVNRAYEGAFGVPREAIVGRTVKEMFGSRFHAIEAHVARALQGESVSFQSELVSDGGYACFESNYIPQRGIDGSVLTGFHAVSTDVTRQKQEEKRLLQLAHEDPLTGLANRAGFNRRLEETLAAAPASGRVAALMFLDLDRFKQVNDQFGHGTGDALLRAVADRLVQALRARDFVARVGGDEFTVIIGQVADAQAAARIAGKIVDALSRPFMLTGCRVDVSASVGVAFHVAGSAATATAAHAGRRRDALPGQGRGPQRLPAGGVSRGAGDGLNRLRHLTTGTALKYDCDHINPIRRASDEPHARTAASKRRTSASSTSPHARSAPRLRGCRRRRRHEGGRPHSWRLLCPFRFARRAARRGAGEGRPRERRSGDARARAPRGKGRERLPGARRGLSRRRAPRVSRDRLSGRRARVRHAAPVRCRARGVGRPRAAPRRRACKRLCRSASRATASVVAGTLVGTLQLARALGANAEAARCCRRHARRCSSSTTHPARRPS